MTPSPALSCPTCPDYTADLLTPSLVVSGSNGDTVRCSTRPGRNADIPPLRLVRILTTMPLFLAVIRGKWAICRSGQGSPKKALFAPDSSKTPSGFSPFRNTERRSVPAVSVPPACAIARSERLPVSAPVGIFSGKTPSGFSPILRRGHGPIEAIGLAKTGTRLPVISAAPARFFRRPWDARQPAWCESCGGHTSPPQHRNGRRTAARRGASQLAWIETLRYLFARTPLRENTERRASPHEAPFVV